MADDFLPNYTGLANEIGTRTGLDPAVVLGIIDLESAGGKRLVGNNIFGISPSRNGRQYVEQYPDVGAASEAFINLMNSPGYASVRAATTPAAQAQALVRSRYNTVNPQWAPIVASKAQAFGRQLGYQEAAPAATTAAPVAPAQQPPAPGSAEAQLTRELGSTAPPQTPATGTAPTAAASGPAPGSAEEQLVRELKPTTTATQTTKPAGPDLPMTTDPYGTPWVGEGAPPNNPAMDRIVDAGVQGWRGSEPIVTPKGEDAINALGPVGRFIVNPALKIAGTGLAAGNALGSALMQTGTEIGTATGHPELGRDINMLAQVAPVAGIPGMAGPAGITRAGMEAPRPPGGAVSRSITVPDREAPGGQRTVTVDPNALAPESFGPFEHGPPAPAMIPPDAPLPPPNALRPEPPAFVPPSATAKPEVPPSPAGGPSPGMGGPRLSPEDHQWVSGAKEQLAEIHAENRAAGVPGSVGAAATPEELAKLTPAQMKAYRRQAELGDILAPPERGVDTKIHVEGSEPTHAEWAGDPAVSQQETLLRQRAPKDYDERLTKNNQARVNSYESMMGTDPQVVGVREAKAQAAERDGAAFVRAAGPIDLQPALGWVDEQLANPRILEQPEIVKTLRQMRESLFDADGKLKTDPQSGWGMHDQNMTRLEKSKLDTKDERFATSQILQFKRLVDDANNKASNGAFQTFLDNQANYAQQINAMTELQKFRTRLTNNKGEINAPAFHKFVTDLAMRRGKAGVDAAMDISDETMRGLINIDRDLKRASNIDLGKARGSGTNLFFALAQQMGLGAAHLGMAAATTGPVGNLLLQGAANTVGKLTGNALLNRKVRKGLAPPPGGYNYNELRPD